MLFLDSLTFATGVWKFSLFLGVGAKESLGSNFFWPEASLKRCSHLLATFCALKTNLLNEASIHTLCLCIEEKKSKCYTKTIQSV